MKKIGLKIFITMSFLLCLSVSRFDYAENAAPANKDVNSIASVNTVKQENTLQTQDPNALVLPSPYQIYVRDGIVMNQFRKGFYKKDLPVKNNYQGQTGCYIACFSKNEAEKGIYTVRGNIYMNGIIRVAGHYENGLCKPSQYENTDISKVCIFKRLCAKQFVSCDDNACWASGETGNLVGIIKTKKNTTVSSNL